MRTSSPRPRMTHVSGLPSSERTVRYGLLQVSRFPRGAPFREIVRSGQEADDVAVVPGGPRGAGFRVDRGTEVARIRPRERGRVCAGRGDVEDVAPRRGGGEDGAYREHGCLERSGDGCEFHGFVLFTAIP